GGDARGPSLVPSAFRANAANDAARVALPPDLRRGDRQALGRLSTEPRDARKRSRPDSCRADGRRDVRSARNLVSRERRGGARTRVEARMSADGTTARPALGELRARYLAAQLAGSRREALRLVLDEGLARGVPALDVELEVIQEAQREIGRLWQENAITVAEEHMATAISHMALSHLYEHAPRASTNGKKVLVACV